MAEHAAGINRNLAIEMHEWEELVEGAFKLIALIQFIKAIKAWWKSKRLATLHGRVVDERTRVPVERILVTCQGSKGCYTTSTSAEGSYRLQGLPPGDYTVVFCDPQGRYHPKVI